ncbi:hypothetical protein ACIFOT_32545 [Neobacillus sp. NRS-1170]|uniref:hypothetical protein n=1 Tax=Neobacillus sp. NRS-1170 TaxID=3233898 RepID=UPI003D2B3C9D
MLVVLSIGLLLFCFCLFEAFVNIYVNGDTFMYSLICMHPFYLACSISFISFYLIKKFCGHLVNTKTKWFFISCFSFILSVVFGIISYHQFFDMLNRGEFHVVYVDKISDIDFYEDFGWLFGYDSVIFNLSVFFVFFSILLFLLENIASIFNRLKRKGK